jgi:ureidoglycolate lyase
VQTLLARPLRAADYAPYGAVLEATAHGAPGKPANEGTARRFDRLASLTNLRPGAAEPNLCVFRCAPCWTWPLPLALLEKHPASTQVFVPMNAQRYLVVVARGDAAPDLSTLAAFVAQGTQAVSYHPGVWHHPMIALETEIDFVCVVCEDGTAGDCVVVRYPAAARVLVSLGG